jgi:hypothetical protein
MTLEERVSRLEGAFEQFPSRIDALENSLRAEIRASITGSENGLRAEIKAAELRITLWLGGFIFAAAGLSVAGIKLLP